MICPSCGSTQVRPSRHFHWGDIFQNMRGRKPYRCRKCQFRFYTSESPEAGQEGHPHRTHNPAGPRSARDRRRIVRRIIAIAIFAVMFLIFLLFLHFLTTDRAIPKEVGEAPHGSMRSLAQVAGFSQRAGPVCCWRFGPGRGTGESSCSLRHSIPSALQT